MNGRWRKSKREHKISLLKTGMEINESRLQQKAAALHRIAILPIPFYSLPCFIFILTGVNRPNPKPRSSQATAAEPGHGD